MAPKDVYFPKQQDKQKGYWIKPSSIKTVAKGAELSELFSKFNSVPFDDRVNRQAKITDIRRGFVEDFLVESGSSLAAEINKKPLEDLLVALEVANITDVGIDIRNIGLLMFAEHPDKFLPGTQIELIRFNSLDAEGSDDFTEKIFTGPLQKQIRDALSYIQATLIEEKVVKVPTKAEVERFFNYPYAALEESLVNAVFHKSYRIQEPVEIRIYLDCIKIINYPGPEKWIDMDKFKEGKAIARRYRNRRIGEFLKEIDLSEKKSTGITKILNALKTNNSPLPEFETDDERNYLITTIKIHEAFIITNSASKNDTDGATVNATVNATLNATQKSIYSLIMGKKGIKVDEMMAQLSKDRSTILRNIKVLVNKGLIVRIGSSKTGYWEIQQ
jgi:ATP-dependent DNA helicase RecG